MVLLMFQRITVYGSKLWIKPMPRNTIEVEIEGMSQKAQVHKTGMLLFGADGKPVSTSSVI